MQVTFHQFMLPQLRADPITGKQPTLKLGILDQKHYPNRCERGCHGCSIRRMGVPAWIIFPSTLSFS